jgi:hypothetical protein
MEEFIRFLAYSYSEQHLNLDPVTTSHSCRFAVNAGGNDGHPSSSNCKRCVYCKTSFDKTLELLDHNDSLVDTSRRHDGAIQEEIKSMRKTVPIFREVVMQYMAHRFRAKVQFAAIKKIYSELSTQKALLTAGHRPKAKSLARGIQRRVGGILWETRHELTWYYAGQTC